MSGGKAAGYVLVGVLAGALIGMAVERSRTAGRLDELADLPQPDRSPGEHPTGARLAYAAVPPSSTPPVTPGDADPFAQTAQGARGMDTPTGTELAERYPPWRAGAARPSAGCTPVADRAGPRGRVARHLIRRVRRVLHAIGSAAGAQALALVALLTAIWRGRKPTTVTWPTWLWIPAVLAPTGARVAVLRDELVAAVRCRPVRGPAGPGVCWPLSIGRCVT